MEDQNKGQGGWMSVPAFGDWDMKHGVPDYSMDFSKIREMRKQGKKDFSRVSVGNEEELIPNHDRRPADDPAATEARHNGVVHHNDEDVHRPSFHNRCPTAGGVGWWETSVWAVQCLPNPEKTTVQELCDDPKVGSVIVLK